MDSRNSEPDRDKEEASGQDLRDSGRDEKKMQREDFSIDMPEVKDIPGQEHIQVPPLGELADTTISSADEEGEELLDGLNENQEE